MHVQGRDCAAAAHQSATKTTEVAVQHPEWQGALHVHVSVYVTEKQLLTQNLTQLWVNHRVLA